MIGNVVGNYKIIDKIGEGGMGSVFKGVDLMLEREVAIKMLRPELARQPQVVERFRTEAVTLAKLNHPNVATLHSFFRQGDDFFMVMEFVRGQTLDDVIKAQGAMQCDRAVELFCMALEGIDHAHKMGIIHRDIKPANMMLTETGSIKVMDFGIARVLGTDRLTRAGHLIGTVEYMSPEQVRGEETDARSDIYSLGILLYEMLTGRVPFNSTSEYELMRCQIEDAPTPPRTFAPQMPLAVEQGIMRALAKNREARYQSASEFRATLIQKTTGAITRVDELSLPAGGYAAPATQVDQAMRMTPPSGEVVKATRLASDPGYSAGAIGGQIKETRLGQSGDQMAGYSQGAPGYYPPVHPVGHSGASILSKLNWKHYAGAGAVLVALITLPLVLFGGAGKSGPQAPVTQPATRTPENAPASAAAPNVQDPNQTAPQVPAATLPLDNPSGASNSSAPGNAKPGRSRTDATAGTAQPPAQENEPSKDAARPSGREASRDETRPAPRREQRAETARDTGREEKKVDKKDKTSKIGEATEAVGGAIKKIGGLFGKKKKNN
jgi:tRNA A-37 threonylcarbamoyl transferase component Bud32